VNYDEKQLTGENLFSGSFYLYRFREYLSYGFPIINFCNPGVHYEMPCILEFQLVHYETPCILEFQSSFKVSRFCFVFYFVLFYPFGHPVSNCGVAPNKAI
jgi:hypothetical protein